MQVDQGFAPGEYCYFACLRDGTGITRDLISAIHDLKLSADQGSANVPFCDGICLQDGIGISRDLQSAAYYFKCSADQEIQAVSNATLQMLLLPRDGMNCQPIIRARGITVDFTVSADFVLKANSFSRCLKRGEGVDANTERAVKYRALSKLWPRN
jgi:TPR repeat protein